MLKLKMTKMALVMSVALTATFSLAEARQKVIYGEDNRVDIVDSINPFFQELALSTAAMVRNRDLAPSVSGLLNINSRTLQQNFGVCTSERFFDQPAAAYCSGFLVAPDLLVTAGHCVIPKEKGGDQCENFSWVFDYRLDALENGTVEASKVYKCAEVLTHELDQNRNSDFALIRLDRPVTDRAPLEFRREGKVEVGTELVVIGHPSGLPTKIADGASVVRNSAEQFFVADLDTYGGNSGSAVIDANTGVVEGILVRGAVDYLRTMSGCLVSNRCTSAGSSVRCNGESVSRISLLEIEKFLD